MLYIVYIYDGISMLLILSIIVSIKRLLLPGNVCIKPSMVGAMRFERLFLELLSSTIVKLPEEEDKNV